MKVKSKKPKEIPQLKGPGAIRKQKHSSSEVKLKRKKKLKSKSTLNVPTDVTSTSTTPEENPPEENSEKQFQKKGKKKKRNTGRTPNTWYVVPWRDTAEWDNACDLFNRGEWKDLIRELLIWKARLPAAPVGVESSFYLVQAFIHDDRTKQLEKSSWIETEESRSLYSLAIIRFLNHVSHLATKELGPSTLPMYKLASHVNIPEWIVNLRHEASHGTSLPSLEMLRFASSFIQDWLKENYWISLESQATNSEAENSVSILRNEDSEIVEAELSNQISQITSAFIATRIYKLRQVPLITDGNILKLLPNQNSHSLKTKSVIIMLKKKLVNFLTSEPDLTCNVLAQEMIPEDKFINDFSAIFDQKDPFEQFCLVFNPIIKLLQKKRKMTRVCMKLAEHQGLEDVTENSLRFSALWLDHILTIIQTKLPLHSSAFNELKTLLHILLKSPNAFTNVLMDRLLEILDTEIGNETVDKLKSLLSIWTDDSSNFNYAKYKRMTGAKPKGELFTCDDIVQPSSSRLSEMDIDSAPITTIQWDTRGSEFWSKIPFGMRF